MDAAQCERMRAVIDRYNRGDYFTAQGDLETLFNELPVDERVLMTLAIAIHLLFQRRGGRGVHNLMRQVMVRLDQLGPECAGVAAGELFEAVEADLQELKSRKKPGAGFFDRWLGRRSPMPDSRAAPPPTATALRTVRASSSRGCAAPPPRPPRRLSRRVGGQAYR